VSKRWLGGIEKALEALGFEFETRTRHIGFQQSGKGQTKIMLGGTMSHSLRSG
jgi:hypothetical protein